MNANDLMATIMHNVGVTRVYGEPCTTNGVTVIPGAVIIGGGGGGGGLSATGDDGGGGGFGVFARPSGAFVISDGDVRWIPAIDYPLLIVAVTGLVTGLLHARQRRRRWAVL